MRYIRVPAHIQVLVTTTAGKELKETTFQEVLGEVWLNFQAQFGTSVSALRSGVKLESLFAKRVPNEWVAVEDADYDRLLKAVNEYPSYNPGVARQLISFVDAITEASKEDPSKTSA